MKKLLYCIFVVSLLISFATLSSCNSRQARVVSKIINGVEHMSDETEAISNGNLYTQNQQIENIPVQEIKYSISGVYQTEDGKIGHIKNNEVVQTPQGLYLADGLGRPTEPVYKNDTQVITETRVVRYSFDEDETELLPYNVSGYAYKCFNGLVTFYFNIGSRIN